MTGAVGSINSRSRVLGKVTQPIVTAKIELPTWYVWGARRGPLAHWHGTHFYLDFGDADNTGTYRNSSHFSNVAANARSIHRWQLPRGSAGGRQSGHGDGFIKPSSKIENVRSAPADTSTGLRHGDHFDIQRLGMTMVIAWKQGDNDGANAGMIYYGNNAQNQHAFVRSNYSPAGKTRYGGDTDSGDTWNDMNGGTDETQGNGFFFSAFSEDATDGSLYYARNGSDWSRRRAAGTIVKPTGTCYFGLFGDPYDDNESRHTILMAAWVAGRPPEQLLKDEFEWVRKKWSSASFYSPYMVIPNSV